MARPKEFDYTTVLDKAVTVFWQHGYEATSIEDLIKHMGIHRGSLYDTFGNKQQLFLAILDRYGQVVVEKLLSILKTSGSPKAAIRQFFSTVIEHIVTAGPLRGCLITNSAVSTALNDPLIAKKVETVLTSIEEGFYISLVQAQKLHELSPGQDPRALARYFTSSLQGLLVMGRVQPDRAKLYDIVSMQLLILE